MTARALVVVVTTLLISLLAGEVRAQSITIGPVITRREGRTITDPKLVNFISYADCAADDKLRVTLTPVNTGNYSFEIWVGTSSAMCQTDSFRQNTGNVPTSCWQIGSFSSITTVTTLDLPVRDILPHNASGANTGSAATCDTVANTSNGSGSLTVTFLLINGSAAVGTPTPMTVTYDLQGPPPPTDLSMGIGDERLFPAWKLNKAATVDTTGYYVFCELAENPGLVSETGGTSSSTTGGSSGGTVASESSGGTAGEADSTTGGTGTEVAATGGVTGDPTSTGGSNGEATGGAGGDSSVSDCRAPHLKAGQVPSADMRVGQTGVNASNGVAKDLTNGSLYACAVAGYDQYLNVGKLSDLVCGIPRPVNGYFKGYRAAGGTAGGGYCAFGHAPITAASGSVVLAALSWLARRRRRQARRG